MGIEYFDTHFTNCYIQSTARIAYRDNSLNFRGRLRTPVGTFPDMSQPICIHHEPRR